MVDRRPPQSVEQRFWLTQAALRSSIEPERRPLAEQHPPSLVEQQTDLSGTTVLLQQHPLRSWMRVWVVSTLLVPVTAGLLSLYLMAGLVLVLHLLIPVMLLVRTQVRLSMTPTRLHLKAWTGRPALPRSYDVPLQALHLERHIDLTPDARCLVTLWLAREGEEPIKIPNVTARGRDILAIEAQLRGRRNKAETRHGHGAAEIPEALKQFRETNTTS